MRQIALPLVTRPEPSFDFFVRGSNAWVVEQLLALQPANAPPVGPSAGLFYLWGPTGSGKTHLLSAVATRFQAQGSQVACFSTVHATPWEQDVSAPLPALILLDHCDDLNAAQQHLAFRLFVEAVGQPVTLIAAGRLPPVDLPLREDLRTRLGWGHVLALQPLAEADVRTALYDAAHARGLSLSEDVVHWLLTRHSRDMRHLMAQIDRLDAYALAHQRAVTLPLLKLMLSEESSVL